MKKILVSVLLVVVSVFALLLTGCPEKFERASNYTEAQHIKRVSALVEKRYMQEDSKYTNYEVFPLYNENDELNGFLVEFQPRGFVYVKLNEQEEIISDTVRSLYTRSQEYDEGWRRFVHEPVYMEMFGQYLDVYMNVYEEDENGEYIYYYNSHFKEANIDNERRYMLFAGGGGGNGYFPAVKRGDKFLNLISMKEVEFSSRTYVNERDIYFTEFPKNNL